MWGVPGEFQDLHLMSTFRESLRVKRPAGPGPKKEPFTPAPAPRLLSCCTTSNTRWNTCTKSLIASTKLINYIWEMCVFKLEYSRECDHMYNTFNHSFLFAPWTNLRISCWLQPHCFHEKLIWIVWFHSPFPFFPAQSFIRAKLHDRRRREYMRNLICMKPSHSPVLHLLYFFIFSLLKESGLNKVRKLVH